MIKALHTYRIFIASAMMHNIIWIFLAKIVNSIQKAIRQMPSPPIIVNFEMYFADFENRDGEIAHKIGVSSQYRDRKRETGRV
jgi:hypothetical protein